MKIMFKTIDDLFKNDELRFKLSIGFQFTFISGLFAAIVFSLTYFLLRLDLIFFESHGYQLISNLHETYYDFVYTNVWDLLPWALLVGVLIFISGYYIAVIMIRPFKLIGISCEEKSNQQVHFYQADYLSDLKLLTSFSSFFFSKVDEAKVKGKLGKIEIPMDYTKIHKPVMEKNFFINYLLVIIILGLLASLGIFILNNEIRQQVLLFSSKALAKNGQIKYFLERQYEVESTAIWSLLVLHLIVNFLFGLHLYEKIASPAFAIFATMRSFLKGNYHNRIHLIGFYYLRNDCRKINQYLDKVQKELT